MKYGLLEYATANMGDEIQSVAAEQFLPRVDAFLQRDFLHDVRSDEDIAVVMNGWFTRHPENWPPSSALAPLFVSFHIAEAVVEPMTTPDAIAYFREHEPIGCRDYHTRDLLAEHGVDAYFSGCLTLTLTSDVDDADRQGVYVVDGDDAVVRNLPSDHRDRAEFVTHRYDVTALERMDGVADRLGDRTRRLLRRLRVDDAYVRMKERVWASHADEQFAGARDRLAKYAAAELVVTSRLHAALPCVAFGTPVLLVHENLDDPRFGGHLDYLSHCSVEEFVERDGEIDWADVYDVPDVREFRRDMSDTVRAFLDRVA